MSSLRVSSHSDPNCVASRLAVALREQGCAEIEPMGATALSQAVKSIALVRGFLAPTGADLVCWPAFAEQQPEATERHPIKLFVEVAAPER